MIKVGVPRALSYYRYFPLWKTLLEGMGAEVVVSAPTGQDILEQGVRHCVDDICVPVKVYYGHVLDLRDRVDRLFVQRLVTVEKGAENAYTCPKLMGLPDMIEHSLDGLPPLVEFNMDLKKRSIRHTAGRIAEALGASRSSTAGSLKRALEAQGRFEMALRLGVSPEKAMSASLNGGNGSGDAAEGAVQGGVCAPPEKTGVERTPPDVSLALVGHEYLLQDDFLSHNLAARLGRLGVEVHLAAEVPPAVIEAELSRYPEISWSYEKDLIGAASHFLSREDIDGVMLVICFACGPDSIVGEIISREVRGVDSPPLSTLVLDEHTGEAGVATRVEAFVDMIRRSRRR